MNKPKCNYRCALGLVVVLLVIFVGSAYGLHATSSTKFCLSCHEMTPHGKELMFSSHATDKNGKPIECSQCHIPNGFGPKFLAVKIYSGLKDLAVHTWEQPLAIDRLAHQPTARRFIDDDNCIACHADLYKDAKGKYAISDIGKIAHDAYLGKNGNTNRNCAGCHINLAHLPEFDQRLEVNASFKARLLKEEEHRK